MQGDLATGDVVDGVYVGVEVVDLAAIDGGGGGEKVYFGLDDVTEAMEIEEVRFDRIIDMPEGCGGSDAGAAEEAGLGAGFGAGGIGSDAFHHVGDDFEFAKGDGPVEFLAGVATIDRLTAVGAGETIRWQAGGEAVVVALFG